MFKLLQITYISKKILINTKLMIRKRRMLKVQHKIIVIAYHYSTLAKLNNTLQNQKKKKNFMILKFVWIVCKYIHMNINKLCLYESIVDKNLLKDINICLWIFAICISYLAVAELHFPPLVFKIKSHMFTLLLFLNW